MFAFDANEMPQGFATRYSNQEIYALKIGVNFLEISFGLNNIKHKEVPGTLTLFTRMCGRLLTCNTTNETQIKLQFHQVSAKIT